MKINNAYVDVWQMLHPVECIEFLSAKPNELDHVGFRVSVVSAGMQLMQKSNIGLGKHPFLST